MVDQGDNSRPGLWTRVRRLGLDVEEFEERAAIIEYEGGLPRAKAEEKAITYLLFNKREKEKKNFTKNRLLFS